MHFAVHVADDGNTSREPETQSMGCFGKQPPVEAGSFFLIFVFFLVGWSIVCGMTMMNKRWRSVSLKPKSKCCSNHTQI